MELDSLKAPIPRQVHSASVVNSRNVSLRCPDCGRFGTFEAVTNQIQDLFVSAPARWSNNQGQDVHGSISWVFGQRRCPFTECHAHVFVILRDAEVVASYPPERIDFDKEGIPERITATLEEAITCLAERCYVASAIMVRRTLEEICEDRDAKGNNLWQRIRKLREKVVISEGLLDGMENLIMLGNDAAHVESRTFERVSKEEVELGIEITKEILKALYQEKNLVERLNSLKKRTS